MPEHLSVSQINCYLNCPRHYMFRYIEKCEPEFIYSALAFGKAMHSALASYNESLQTDAPLKTETVQALFRADWQAETVQPLRFGSTETAESLLATGQTLLAEYVTAKKPEVVACEESFEVMLRDPTTAMCWSRSPLSAYSTCAHRPGSWSSRLPRARWTTTLSRGICNFLHIPTPTS